MNAEKLMNAIGNISSRHIVEFSEVKVIVPSRKIWLTISSLAACVLFVVSLFLLRNVNQPPGGSVSAIPLVKFNDMIYIIDSNYTNSTKNELPDGYVAIGTIERNPKTTNPLELTNGDAFGCSIGEVIYQHPEFTNEVYVLTTLFSGDSEYRFIRFVTKD